MFLVSNFFIGSKFSLQVIFRANLYISGMPFLIPGIWNGSSPMPQPQHAHWFTPPLRSSWNQPLLNLLPQPSSNHGPLQSIFHHIPIFSCKLLAGTAARPEVLPGQKGGLHVQELAAQEGVTPLFLGPEDPNYLKTINPAAKNQPFSQHCLRNKTFCGRVKKEKKPWK